jgi:hypothetical protein
MEQNTNKEIKGYLETKLSRSICVLLTLNKYKYDLKKMVEFIKKNRSYFPEILDEELELLKDANVVDFVEDPEHNEQVPIFAELDFEKNNFKKK